MKFGPIISYATFIKSLFPKKLDVAGSFLLVAWVYVSYAQDDLSSYGVPIEPLITSDTENQRQAEQQHEEGGHHHHHHSGNPLDWLRESIPGNFNHVI